MGSGGGGDVEEGEDGPPLMVENLTQAYLSGDVERMKEGIEVSEWGDEQEGWEAENSEGTA